MLTCRGVYFTQRLQLCGVYLRAASIQGWCLFAEIRPSKSHKNTTNDGYARSATALIGDVTDIAMLLFVTVRPKHVGISSLIPEF